MIHEFTTFARHEYVGCITFSRPDHDQAINRGMVLELAAIQEELALDDTIRVVVITGTGTENFCSGVDAEEWSEVRRIPEEVADFSLASVIQRFDVPVIAAINGRAIGAGLEAALAADLRFCSETARLGMPQAVWGEMPWDGGTQRLPRLIGRSAALELLFTGREVDAREAYHIGLVNQVLSPERLMPETLAVAQKMAAKGPIALRYIKESVMNGLDMSLSQGLRLEADLYFLLHTTRDRHEGVTAFREKRTPTFEGR